MSQLASKSTVLSASLADIFVVAAGDAKTMTLSTKVSGAALTAFEVWARGDAQADFVKLAGSSSDYSVPTVLMLAANGSSSTPDLTTTAAGDTAVVQVDVSPWYEVKLRAAGAGASVNVTGWSK